MIWPIESMIGRITTTVLFVLSAGILFTSVLRAASIEFEFEQDATPAPESPANHVDVDYLLPIANEGMDPDNLFWPIRAVEDRVRIAMADETAKADEILNVADKRLVASQMLFEEGEIGESVGSLIRAEGYLEQAHLYALSLKDYPDEDLAQTFVRIVECALKHRQVIEEMLAEAPEDARPVIVQTLDTSKRVFDEARAEITQRGLQAPVNPFEGAR